MYITKKIEYRTKEFIERDMIRKSEEWDLVITGRKKLLSLQLSDIVRYRDLLFMLVKRDFVVLYKQTILGPLWFFIQPALTCIVYIVVFTRIARISTDGVPPILFYLSGIIIWNYFQDCFINTSNTFVQNTNLFGKVYFPRIVVPLAKILSGLLKFSIQLFLFIGIYLFYVGNGYDPQVSTTIFYVPLMIAMMGFLGFGLGVLLTSLTTKYRDLVFLIQFGVQLLMYATPVIYPLSSVPEKYKFWVMLNPMTSVLEGFRSAFLATGSFKPADLFLSSGIILAIVIVGLSIFNYTEKDFMDTV